jgi:uncharacterized membrane protein YfcA
VIRDVSADGAAMSRPASAAPSSTGRLAAIGVGAGFLSALMGVGGGILVVPALTLLLQFPVKLATGSSLVAILITAVAGALTYGILGYVDVGAAVALGLPAAAGAIAGTWLQQRLSSHTVQLAFSGFLVLTAIMMLVSP